MNAKYYKAIAFLRQCSLMKRRLILPFRLIKSGFIYSESYFPELPGKTKFRVFLDNIGRIIKYGSIEWNYFSYGLDIKGFRDSRVYMDESEFIWQNNMLNTVQTGMDYTCILRDKGLFAELLSLWGFKTPRTMAVVSCDSDVERFVEGWGGKESLFCKPVDGQCGSGAFKVSVSTGGIILDGMACSVDEAKETLIKRLSSKTYLIQNLIEQLPVINSIYPGSLNTLRITTYYDKNNQCAAPFAAFFRTGTRKGEVDNWAVGGLAIGVDIHTGKLDKYGFYKHGNGGKTDRHPDTGFVFEGFMLPNYEQAIQQALALHERINGIPVIGWDIAFTKGGILFIEGNDNSEIAPLQVTCGKGLKKEYYSILKDYLG